MPKASRDSSRNTSRSLRRCTSRLHNGAFRQVHLGHSGPYEPKDQGFDFDFPHTPSAPGPGGGYLAPWKFIKDPAITGKPGEHIEDRMSEEARSSFAPTKTARST